MKSFPDTIMRVRIEKIITGGQGLARLENGMILLTRFVLPGELVEVRETARYRGYLEADPVRILEPDPERVPPACPHYGICGGCDFQHISGLAQLRIKEEMCRESLERAGLDAATAVIAPALTSPASFHYRSRIRLQVNDKGQPGFFRFRSKLIVPVDRCPVATEQLNAALQEICASPASKPLAAVIREIDLLHSPADNHVHALLLPDRGKRIDRRLLAGWVNNLRRIPSVWLRGREGMQRLDSGHGPDLLRQEFPPEVCGQPFSLSWSPGCFSQVNAAQNVRLLSLVLALAGQVAGRIALDLFCGMGNFSVPLALAGAKVVGVERGRDSVARARTNAAAAGCHDARFIAADVATALGNPAITAGAALIVLDPPRQGLGKDSIRLAEVAAGRIIYISCDPATLMRDLALLCGRGYRLRQLAPVDMFPQTHHIEAVALLEKN